MGLLDPRPGLQTGVGPVLQRVDHFHNVVVQGSEDVLDVFDSVPLAPLPLLGPRGGEEVDVHPDVGGEEEADRVPDQHHERPEVHGSPQGIREHEDRPCEGGESESDQQLSTRVAGGENPFALGLRRTRRHASSD